MHNKVLFSLSLARKAGVLVTGFDSVKDSVLKHKAFIVVFAADISPATKKRMLRQMEQDVAVYKTTLTQFELSQITKKPVGVLAITEKGLAVLCQNAILAEIQGGK